MGEEIQMARVMNGDAGHPACTVFVDELFTAVSRMPEGREAAAEHGHQWCHMWSDDLDALHAMATRIGMRREWFQDKPGFPHYDLVPPLREKAIAMGAVAHKLREYIRRKRKAE
jgi:hypothetical protein